MLCIYTPFMTPEPTITLPLSVLRSLLFRESGDDNFPRVRIQSLALGDLAKVIVTHKVIGELISSIDNKEEYFHVEIFSTHAEIWMIFEWRESNAKRERFRIYHETLNAKRAQEKDLLAELQDKISATRLPDIHCRLISEQIYGLYKAGQFQKVVDILDGQLGLNIAETLKNYKPLP